MRTKSVLSATDAATITAACTTEASRHGWPVSVAVVDDGGRLLSVIRLDGAGYATPDAARRKAETSAKTRSSTADLEAGSLRGPHYSRLMMACHWLAAFLS